MINLDSKLVDICLFFRQTFDLTYCGDIQNTIDISNVIKKRDIKFEVDGVMTKIPDMKKQREEFTRVHSVKELKDALVKEGGDNVLQIDSEIDRFKNFSEHSPRSLHRTYNELQYLYDDKIMEDYFLSVLPYEGNENTVEFIKELLISPELNLEIIQKLRLLINLPRYLARFFVKYPDFLLLMKHEDQIVQNVAVLSHSQLVNTAHEMTDEKYNNVNKYLQVYKSELYLDKDQLKLSNKCLLFAASSDYETRMIYLLGLYNMNATLDVWMPIIMDNHESRHLRLIAIKSSLKQVQKYPLQVCQRICIF